MSNMCRILAMSAIGTAIVVLFVLMAGCIPVSTPDSIKVDNSQPVSAWEEMNVPVSFYYAGRTKVPGGWLVILRASNSCAAAVVSDVNHSWRVR